MTKKRTLYKLYNNALVIVSFLAVCTSEPLTRI